jgi:hypothetical protein
VWHLNQTTSRCHQECTSLTGRVWRQTQVAHGPQPPTCRCQQLQGQRGANRRLDNGDPLPLADGIPARSLARRDNADLTQGGQCSGAEEAAG